MVTLSYVIGTARGHITVPVGEVRDARRELDARGAVILHSVSTRD